MTLLLIIVVMLQICRAWSGLMVELQMINMKPTHLSYLMPTPLYDEVCGDADCPCSYTGLCTKNVGLDRHRSPVRWEKEY